ncbi:hypothetical protein RRG08_032901 [Elysia crispata]|uniref:Chitinase n=1 Tax=Elysia crispata TaxID=231223 RepID=A0AAE1DTI7_9GAST|nr:hypothetical protein RRG08_032901 [Elysia crispata]
MLWTAFLILLALGSANSLRSVCYYTNWSQYRSSVGQFYPEDVDASLCTHLIYSFANIVGTDIIPFEWNDDSTPWSKGMYERTMALKTRNPALKIILAVGGYNMASLPFVNIVRNSASRSSFAQSAVAFLRQRNFDGLDVDWEYPAQRGSAAADKRNFVLLMQELRTAFENEARVSGSPRLLLTAAVPAGKNSVDVGYDVPALSRLCDFISLMTYDLHGSWDSTTGINSPLYAHPSEQGDDTYLSLDWVAKYYVSLGAPRDKINIGMATYGRSFTLADTNNNGVGAPAARAGRAGRYTMENGFISYYEICQLIQSGAQVFQEPSQRARYLVQRDLWIGYDDVQTIQEKACYARQNSYGGIMFWALDLDDFKGQTCGQGRYPLIRAAVQEMAKPASAPCFRQANPVNPGPSLLTPQLYQPLTAPQAINQPQTTPPPGQPANPLIRTLPTYGLTPLPPQATLIPNTPTAQTQKPLQPVTLPSQPVQPFQPVTRPNQPGQPLQPLTQTTKPPVSIATLPPITIATLPPVTIATLPSITIATLPPGPASTASSGQGITFTQTTSFDCRGKANDFYADPLSCDYFYICANSITYRVRCALGLKFNTQLKHCDFAYNVKCQGISTVQSTAMTSRKASTITSKLYQPITYPSITQRTNQPATTKQPITPKLYQPIINPPVTPRPYQPATNSPITQKPPNPATTTLPVSSQKPYQPVTNPPSRTTQKIYQPRTNPPAATTQKLYQPLTNPPASATRQPAQPINNIRGSSPKPYVPLTFMPVTLRPGAGTTVKPLQPATQIASLPLPSGQAVNVQGNPCRGIPTGLLPHPTQCGKYLQCGFGMAFSLDCPQHLVFNPSMGMCDHQYNYPGCPRANGK